MIFKSRLLIAAILSSLYAVNAVRDDVIVLLYETDADLHNDPKSPLHFFQERAKVANLQTAVYGGNMEYHGYGHKYPPLKPLLEVIEKDKLVVLTDARDVVLNLPANEAVATLKIDKFIETFTNLRTNAPNAVVMSAEAQCCVAAMAHNGPSDYFDQKTKERTMRACPSGADNCQWFQSDHLDDWQNWMKDLAFKTTGKDASDVYLNAGLMAGYPDDLLNLLNVADLNPSEDDQAVFSGLMHEFPDMIVLDYEAELFGNNQWTRGLEDGCVFKSQGDNLSLFHTETANEPVFLHTPGRFYDCLDMLIEELGGVSQQRYLNAQSNALNYGNDQQAPKKNKKKKNKKNKDRNKQKNQRKRKNKKKNNKTKPKKNKIRTKKIED